ncbi:MazG nucleotide pyrophosphohydrolase domain-containing protein [Desulfurivibrio dismutans]|uniref:MazG nucleotide pyrophosphohydrolase domain-containing protein n=1 Tax=Desulfurivibrio dismutans TaxID=1398908 RepID=UPI0023DBFEC4|nr:MazG nucleotide pyrophosphohydrolase domain-containing protein [Desulfurivibrio alkaliphilus]MDF1614705.1 MazG nucleotide pyrophosphohydrolase domain-containing protein [Desulfurivibrio alkaliphilus]
MSTHQNIPLSDLQPPEEALLQLTGLIARLRSPQGCPWDRKQTPASFKRYLLEEAHELHESLDGDDLEHICEELGDLLFQVLFIAEMYREQGAFTLSEVINGIIGKMVRRHPHVFGDRQVASEDELRRQWEAIKETEKKDKGPLTT